MKKVENVGHELSDAELSTVQGGGIFDAIGDGLDAVGRAINRGVMTVGGVLFRVGNAAIRAVNDGVREVAEGISNEVVRDVRTRFRRLGF